MIKMRTEYTISETTLSYELVPTHQFYLKSKGVNRWYSLRSYEKGWWREDLTDITVGPSCLSAWT